MHTSRFTALPRFVAFLCTGIVCGSSGFAQSDLAFEPYTVFVINEDAHARCGPSDEYYRTDPLRHGQSLEVYAETEDGWLGVRPPSDSFCWIPAETVDLQESDEVGTIVEDRTVAWIGTHLGRARTYRWQVQLAEGEPVTVIGKSERDGPDGPQLWYRIVPPSGEYRWIHRDHVVMSSEELVAATKSVTEPGITNSRRESSAETDRTARSISRRASSRRRSQANEISETTNAPGSRQQNDRSPTGPTQTEQSRNDVAAIGSSVLQRSSVDPSAEQDAWQSNAVRHSVGGAEQVEQDATVAFDNSAARKSDSVDGTVTEAMKQRGLLASVEFIGRPRLIDIGGQPSAPNSNTPAGDSNWITGVSRRNPVAPSGNTVDAQSVMATPADSANAEFNPIMQVSGQRSVLPQQQHSATATLTPTLPPTLKPVNYVSAERISEIEQQTADAGIDQLSLVFSRLMATSASAAEAEPVARAARTLASMSADQVVAGRARLLAERAEQYQRLATRRDGPAVVRTSAGIEIPFAAPIAGRPQSTAPAPGSTEAQASQSGYLVQVYSARANSPPFALTDNVGRTLAYVTPSPGVNLRNHLNSKITVTGTPGYVTGLNTPHIVASGALRVPE